MSVTERPPFRPPAPLLIPVVTPGGEFRRARLVLTNPVAPVELEGLARLNAAGGVDFAPREAREGVAYSSYLPARVLRVDWLRDEPTAEDLELFAEEAPHAA